MYLIVLSRAWYSSIFTWTDPSGKEMTLMPRVLSISNPFSVPCASLNFHMLTWSLPIQSTAHANPSRCSQSFACTNIQIAATTFLWCLWFCPQLDPLLWGSAGQCTISYLIFSSSLAPWLSPYCASSMWREFSTPLLHLHPTWTIPTPQYPEKQILWLCLCQCALSQHALSQRTHFQ